MAITKTIGYQGQIRKIELSGSSGAKFELYVKQGSNYYNWDTDSFQTIEKILKFQEIPSNGIYTKSINIPTVTSNTSYDFYIRVLPGSTLGVSTTHEQKIGVLYQKTAATATFNTTSAASLVIQNTGSAGTDLTGGTISNNVSTLNQTGTITKSGTPLIYIHETPSWNTDDGGNWTNTNNITSEVLLFSGNKVKLVEDGGDNIAVDDLVTGENIIDEITVSAISGDLVTLSTAQNLRKGQTLGFSKGGWRFKSIKAVMTNSGTTAVTMNMDVDVFKVGTADIASACVVDSFVSVKPNAFPVSVNCPAGGSVGIRVHGDCTNYLGQLGDNDANQSDKRYKIHSIPTTSTSSSGIAAAINLAADASMGGSGVGAVTYTTEATMKAGDTDYFYYKTTDVQDPIVASSTTQGKISITIV